MDIAILAYVKAHVDIADLDLDDILWETFNFGISQGQTPDDHIPDFWSKEKKLNKARTLLARYGDEEEQARYGQAYCRRLSDSP